MKFTTEREGEEMTKLEKTDPLVALEEALKTASQHVRAKLAAEDIGEMELTINVTGRVLSGHLKVEFLLGEYGERVHGGNLANVVEEFLRREGWKDRNATLCLPAID